MRREDGFTLLELVVVMAIMAMATLLALPMIRPGSSAAPLDEAAQSVLQIFSSAKTSALRTGRDADIVFDAGSRTFAATRASDEYSLPSGIEAVATARKATGNSQKVVFTFFGEGASSGGSVRLGSGADTRSIKVSWITGQVVVETP